MSICAYSCERRPRARARKHITLFKRGENVGEGVGSKLLGSIAPGGIGGAMALYHQTIETEVESLAADIGDEVAASTNVRGVAKERQFGHTAAELKGNVPKRGIAVDGFLVAGEATQNGCQVINSLTLETFQRSQP